MSGQPRPLYFALMVMGGISCADSALAHTRSQSFSSWKIQSGLVSLMFTIRLREARSLLRTEVNSGPGLDLLLVEHLNPRLSVAVAGEVCRTIARPRSLRVRQGFMRVEWRFKCRPGGAVAITNNAFFDLMPSHIHYARVSAGEGSSIEYLFTDAQRRSAITNAGQQETKSHGASFGSYVLVGIQHILIGVDHLAFLASLLLVCRSVRDVVFLVTGFTVGHSITLSLAVLGIIEPNVPLIEALIGFTIALVATENISVITDSSKGVAVFFGLTLLGLALLKVVGEVGPPAVTLFGLALFTSCYLMLSDSREAAARLRPALTVLFGLIHGFGFASVLMEIGMPTNRLVSALFGFNLGVEIGQLGIVISLGFAAKRLFQSSPTIDGREIGNMVSVVLCSLGLYWFIQRGYTL